MNDYKTRQPGIVELRRFFNSVGDHMVAVFDPDTGAESPDPCDSGYCAQERTPVGWVYNNNASNSIVIY